jgi:hypothetical protein
MQREICISCLWRNRYNDNKPLRAVDVEGKTGRS